jgi:hypothetical protein
LSAPPSEVSIRDAKDRKIAWPGSPRLFLSNYQASKSWQFLISKPFGEVREALRAQTISPVESFAGETEAVVDFFVAAERSFIVGAEPAAPELTDQELQNGSA